MNTHTEKSKGTKGKSVANSVAQHYNVGKPAFQFVDNRPEAVRQRKLQKIADNIPQAGNTAQLLAMVGPQGIQRKKKEEGLVQKKGKQNWIAGSFKGRN